MENNIVITRPATANISELASQINAAHNEFESSWRKGLLGARRAAREASALSTLPFYTHRERNMKPTQRKRRKPSTTPAQELAALVGEILTAGAEPLIRAIDYPGIAKSIAIQARHKAPWRKFCARDRLDFTVVAELLRPLIHQNDIEKLDVFLHAAEVAVI